MSEETAQAIADQAAVIADRAAAVEALLERYRQQFGELPEA